jgi:hypothetical protein
VITKEAQEMQELEARVFKPGDLWRDKDGTLWFVVRSSDGDLTMYSADGGYGPPGITYALHKPMTRVHREES